MGDIMNNLNLNILQDFIDINGGTFNICVSWRNGEMFIAPINSGKGAAIEFRQVPLSPTIETELKAQVLKNMPELNKITVNKVINIHQEATTENKMLMQNKFKQAMDFEIELHSNRPARIEAFTYYGIQRLEHEFNYIRALFTTNPYFATVFNGIRIVPYEKDIHALGDTLIETVKAYADMRLEAEDLEDSLLHFKVEKAFQVTFYLDGNDVTKNIHSLMNKNKETQTTIDEFGFIAYIAFYQIFKGELNNQVALTDL